jgi:hypothetical protein
MAGETRRGFLKAGLAAAAGLTIGSAAQAAGPLMPAVLKLPRRFEPQVGVVRPELLARARAALAQHGHRVLRPELVGIADYTRQSAQSRFHLVDMVGGRVTSFLVAHGRGSDPDHSGWVQYFSNEVGSLASSRGAYVTGERYTGKYGLSLRLSGLDYSNSNALERAIVVHGASYVSEQMIQDHGKLGRSEGCFAVPEKDLYAVLARLTPGHMIFADKA